jgi:hypothetical protein
MTGYAQKILSAGWSRAGRVFFTRLQIRVLGGRTLYRLPPPIVRMNHEQLLRHETRIWHTEYSRTILSHIVLAKFARI